MPETLSKQEDVVLLSLDKIHRGVYQPREYFDPEAMEATKNSIREKGLKIPVIVREIRQGNPLFDPNWADLHYELADGERRFRCCSELGFKTIKAMVRDLSDAEMLDYSVTTNDSLPLNPIEKARVFSRMASEFGKTQEDIAKSFNLKQQQVSEIVRLLELPFEVQDLTARAVITVRHARELLKVSDSEKVIEISRDIADKRLSTRDISRKVKEIKGSNELINDKINQPAVISDSRSSLSPSKGNLSSQPQRTTLLTFIDGLNMAFFPRIILTWVSKLSDLRPERLITLMELTVFLPAVVFFALYMGSPIFGVGLGAIFASILLFEKLSKLQ